MHEKNLVEILHLEKLSSFEKQIGMNMLTFFFWRKNQTRNGGRRTLVYLLAKRVKFYLFPLFKNVPFFSFFLSLLLLCRLRVLLIWKASDPNGNTYKYDQCCGSKIQTHWICIRVLNFGSICIWIQVQIRIQGYTKSFWKNKLKIILEKNTFL